MFFLPWHLRNSRSTLSIRGALSATGMCVCCRHQVLYLFALTLCPEPQLSFYCCQGCHVSQRTRAIKALPSISPTYTRFACALTTIYIYNHIYIYICMYRYTCMYVCTYIHIHIHTYMHTCIHTCIHIYLLDIDTGTETDIGMGTYIYIYTHIV